MDACPLAWNALEEGGWDSIGATEVDGGGDATLRDLVEVAKAWGSACIPLPLMETIWAKRWSVAARAVGGPVSLSVARARQGDQASLAPFGALAGVGIARSIGGDDSFERGPIGLVEPSAMWIGAPAAKQRGGVCPMSAWVSFCVIIYLPRGVRSEKTPPMN
jgi:hypothetical protein